MKVNIRFLCYDIYNGDKNDFDFELDDGATLGQLIEEAHGLPHVEVALSELKKSVILVNSEKSVLSKKLKNGDKVTVLRPLGGG